MLLGMSMYYTFLYTQISEDINEIKYKLKNCDYSEIKDKNPNKPKSESFKPKRNQKKK